MATRSTVGYLDTSNTHASGAAEVVAVYAHYDGYPESMMPRIQDYLDTFGSDAFKRAIDDGRTTGIRAIRRLEGMLPSIELFPEDGSTWDYTKTRDNIVSDDFEEYCYIVDLATGKIVEHYAAQGGGGHLNKLGVIERFYNERALVAKAKPAAAPKAEPVACKVAAAIADIKAATPGISKAAALRQFRANGGSCAGKRFKALFDAV